MAHQAMQQHMMLLHAQNARPSTQAPKPDPKQPDTLGWREWTWDAKAKCLKSPSQGALWPTEQHIAHQWSETDAVRGVAGIHALLVPKHWKILHELGHRPLGGSSGEVITGIVERFGKYVLGTEGWRAEQVIIRELLAPSTEIGLQLEQTYPNVIVHYSDQLEGDTPCKSVTSSGLEKGSRSLLPQSSPSSVQSLPPPSPAQSPHLIRWLASPTPPSGSVFLLDTGSQELARRAARLKWLPILWLIVVGGWSILLLVQFLR